MEAEFIDTISKTQKALDSLVNCWAIQYRPSHIWQRSAIQWAPESRLWHSACMEMLNLQWRQYLVFCRAVQRAQHTAGYKDNGFLFGASSLWRLTSLILISLSEKFVELHFSHLRVSQTRANHFGKNMAASLVSKAVALWDIVKDGHHHCPPTIDNLQ